MASKPLLLNGIIISLYSAETNTIDTIGAVDSDGSGGNAGSATSTGSGVKTGDDANLLGSLLLAIAAAMVAAYTFRGSRRSRS